MFIRLILPNETVGKGVFVEVERIVGERVPIFLLREGFGAWGSITALN